MNFVGLKQHYTEARLVQLLEERGIGRPSTFSSLVDKIQERGYVNKQNVEGRKVSCKDFELTDDNIYEVEQTREFGGEKNKLVIQSLGILVMEFLDAHFFDLLNYDYTSGMEDELDSIANGKGNWTSLCRKCDEQLTQCVKNIKRDDILAENNNINLGKYEDQDVFIKKGKFGLYACVGQKKYSLKDFNKRNIEDISFQEVEKCILEQDNCFTREITKDCSIRRSKKGDYIFFKTVKMKKPKFFNLDKFPEDYTICDVNIVKSWIKETYDVNV
jgi:DNA topoisomerase-1